MNLSEYPVPANNNSFGWHYLPQPADSGLTLDVVRAELQQMQAEGAMWIKLLTAPGGDMGWQRGCARAGSDEMTFCEALDQDFGVVLRLYNSWAPPYLTPAVKANLLHHLQLAEGKTFYVEPSNEIDAEAKGSISDANARKVVQGIVDFHDWCWKNGSGQIIPVWPSFGYGGTAGRNWFELVHDMGRGDVLDNCAVAVHNYPKGDKLYKPWDADYLAGTPLTREEFEAMPWRWTERTLEQVNRKRAENAEMRAKLTTDDELMAAYASGWFTWKWTQLLLNRLGHTQTPMLLTETGLRVGEMADDEPRIDPLLHKERSIELIEDARTNPLIMGIFLWLRKGKLLAPIDYAWEDANCISPIWNRRWNKTMSAGEYAQIITPNQLPFIDWLKDNPIAPGGKA